MKTNVIKVDFKKNLTVVKGKSTAKILAFVPREPTLTEIIKNDHFIFSRFNCTSRKRG